MEYNLHYNNITIPYTVIFSTRRKTMAIIVHKQKGVCVRVPKGIPPKDIKHWVYSNGTWIVNTVEKIEKLKQQEEYILKEREKSPPSLTFLGIEYPIQYIQDKKTRIYIQENTLYIHSASSNKEVVHKKVIAWLRKEAQILFQKIYTQCLEQFMQFCTSHFPHHSSWYGKYSDSLENIFMPKIVLRSMKKRYGSLKQNGILTLNTSLIHLSIPTIQCVIYHELAHSIEFNHSKRFFTILSALCPNWKKEEQILHTYNRLPTLVL